MTMIDPAHGGTLSRRSVMGAGAALALGAPSAAFPARRRTFNVRDYGAVGDGTTINTRAIQAAIDACHAAGGGMIAVPAGVFMSGSIMLKPGVGLELRKGGVLKGSPHFADYPLVMRRFAEAYLEPLRLALVNASHNHGLRIVGPGTLDGNGEPFWRGFFNRADESLNGNKVYYHWPQLCSIEDCDDVLVSGVTFKDSAFWNLHMYRCRRSVVEDCRFVVPHVIRAPSSDGIDLDSCQDITIRRCRFSVDDDCIALKGTQGAGAAAYTEAPPVERIHIHDCLFEHGLGCVTYGSNATIVRDVKVERITNVGDIPTIRFKVRPDTPGQVYDGLHVNGLHLAEAPTPIDRWHNGEVFYGTDIPNFSPSDPAIGLIVNARLTHGTKVEPREPGAIIRNVLIEGVTGTTRGFGNISGNATTRVSDFTLRNIDVRLTDPALSRLVARGVRNLRLDNVRVNGAPAEVVA